MYNEKIETLIKAALADGVLTEKEKQILFKRAEAEGIDLDEFEMVLDARLVELEKGQKTSAPKSDKFGDIRKCPACGAIISSGIAKCKECGYAFTESASTVSREKLFNALLQIDKECKDEGDGLNKLKNEVLRVYSLNKTKKSTQLKASTIINFVVPNTKADLLDFLSFLSVQADPAAPKEYVAGINGEREDLGYAYWLLYSSCINKAKISFARDSDFKPFFEKYGEQLTISKKFRLSKTAKTIIGIVVLYLLLFFIGYLFWDDLMGYYNSMPQ